MRTGPRRPSPDFRTRSRSGRVPFPGGPVRAAGHRPTVPSTVLTRPMPGLGLGMSSGCARDPGSGQGTVRRGCDCVGTRSGRSAVSWRVRSSSSNPNETPRAAVLLRRRGTLPSPSPNGTIARWPTHSARVAAAVRSAHSPQVAGPDQRPVQSGSRLLRGERGRTPWPQRSSRRGDRVPRGVNSAWALWCRRVPDAGRAPDGFGGCARA